VINVLAISQGGVTLRHGGLVAIGMTNTIVPFMLETFGYALTPKLIVFVLSLKPVPTIVRRVPTGPVSGWTDVSTGDEDGETPVPVHAEKTTATHTQSTRMASWLSHPSIRAHEAIPLPLSSEGISPTGGINPTARCGSPLLLILTP
jgi:hypothetical protein